MRMKKRICAILVAISILLAGLPAAAASAAAVSGDTVSAKAGEIIQYTVSLSDNPGIAAFRILLEYDKDVLEVVSDEDGSLACTQGEFTAKGNMIAGKTETGCQVLWYHTSNVKGTGALFTLTMKCSDTAKTGEYPIQISYAAEDTINADGEEIVLSCSDGLLTVREPAPVFAGSTMTLAPGEIADFSVDVRDNPGIAGYCVDLAYDKTILRPVMDSDDPSVPACMLGTFADSGTVMCAETATGCRILWYNAEDVKTDGSLFGMQFAAVEPVSGGTTEITVSYRAADTVNVKEERVSFACENATVYLVENAGDHLISYDANGGAGAPVTQCKSAGEALLLSEVAPTRNGYMFLGWAEESDATTPEYQPGEAFSEDRHITLYAVWDENAPDQLFLVLPEGVCYAKETLAVSLAGTNVKQYTYEIRRDSETGEIVASGTAAFGSGFEWIPDSAGEYVIRCTAENSSGDTATVMKTVSVEKARVISPEIPEIAGTSSFGTQLIIGFNEVEHAESYDLYLAKAPYTLEDICYRTDDVVTKKQEIVKDDGSIYYNYTVDKTKIADGYYRIFLISRPNEDVLCVEKSMGLSVGTAAATYYDVSYDANGGSDAPAAQKKEAGVPLALSEEYPEREGYTFIGWATQSDAVEGTYQPGDLFREDRNVTLYAVWETVKPVLVTVGTAEVFSGQQVTVPVNLRDNTGIAGFTLEINYDATCLTLDEITKGALLTTGIFAPNVDSNTVSWGASDDISGDGCLLQLTFTVRGDCEAGVYNIGLSLAEDDPSNFTNDVPANVPVSFQTGSIAVQQIFPGDLTDDGDVTVADAVKLVRYLAKLVELNDREQLAANLNGDQSITSADAVLLLQAIAAPSGAESAALQGVEETVITIAGGTASGVPGGQVTVPVRIKNNSGIAGFALAISYDESALNLSGISAGELLDEGMFEFQSDNGVAIWANIENKSEDGVLLYLTFDVPSGTDYGEYSVELQLKNQKPSNLTDENSKAVSCRFESGEIQIEQLAVNQVSYKDGTLTFDLVAEEGFDPAGLKSYVALYQNEQMVCAQSISLQNARNEISLNGDQSFDLGKVFFMNTAGIPVCKALWFS